jgi:hypothetical protein
LLGPPFPTRGSSDLYGALPSFYLTAARILPWLFEPPAWILGVMGLLLYWYVGFQYAGEVRRRLGRVES